MNQRNPHRRLPILLLVLWVTALLSGCASPASDLSQSSQETEAYLTMDSESYVLRDQPSDSEFPRNLTVKFQSTDGPTKLRVKVAFPQPDPSTAMTEYEAVLTVKDSASFLIPADCLFSLSATALEGKNGYAAFLLSMDPISERSTLP